MKRPWDLNATWFQSVRTISSLFLILAVTVTGCGGDGDDNTSPDDPFVPRVGINTRILRVDTDDCPEVAVYFSVNNLRTSEPRRGLTDQNFQVIEDGNARVIKDWDELDNVSEAIVFSMVLDYSVSVADQDLINTEGAATFFVNQLFDMTDPLLNWGEITKFARDSSIIQTFTDDKDLIIDGIAAAYPDRGITGTELYDSIWHEIGAMVSFKATTSGLPERSIIIVETDGRDSGYGDYGWRDVTDAAKTAGIEVFSVGFGDEVALRPLFNIAIDTNGLYFYVPTSDDLEEVKQSILDSLQHQYRVVYDSTASATPTHSVEVEVSTDTHFGSDSFDFACP